jgi:hypothetical protein
MLVEWMAKWTFLRRYGVLGRTYLLCLNPPLEMRKNSSWKGTASAVPQMRYVQRGFSR